MRDFVWPGNGTIGTKAIPLIRKTWHVRDFANFGNRGRIAIPLGRKRNRRSVIDFAYSGNAVGVRFREFRKSRPMSDFDGQENGALEGNDFAYCETCQARDFANFGNQGGFPISPDRETEPLAVKRFRVFRKRGLFAISIISHIMAGARFRLPGQRGHWQKTISLVRRTRPSPDFDNCGNRRWCAISLARKTEPLAGSDFAYLENAFGA